ncbi:hypothetical protein ACO34A_28500 (plasmid) [Rhizobium sp. ACO-34A]|nr:hypothetical protein [Rhizobium sp. ACO-34A]ATN37709.1 hypothetical protein ACO34A_28500 [Rhizobium sp. ACO-34A]
MGALPLLRLAARIQIGDEKAADRLVELTLRRAMRELRSMPPDCGVRDWLGRLLLDVYDDQGASIMN